MIDKLLSAGAEVTAYDPEAIARVKEVVGDKINYVENEYDALDDADALLIVTEWQLFRSPDFNEVKKRMNQHVIFDGRNLFDTDTIKQKGFDYFSIGRP
jgi:UDPglucose 6-dehydrogenase